MGNDPWKHRSKGMRCATCMWFMLKELAKSPSPDDPITDRGGVGRCRRHAPTMHGFPVVFEGDWCGDHRLDENKV